MRGGASNMEVNISVVVAVCEVPAEGGAWAGCETRPPGAAHDSSKYHIDTCEGLGENIVQYNYID